MSGEPDPPTASPAWWIARWHEGRTAFHRDGSNPQLVAHAAAFLPRRDERVLVPLCGKSFDLVWLEQRGHLVVGVEVAETAVRAFLAEQQRTFVEAPPRRSSPFRVFATGRLELWLGDFFALDPRRHGPFDAIFDRAALIAIGPERRREYAQKTVELLSPRGRILLVGLDYDAHRMAGPPFCVPRAELASLYGDRCEISLLGERNVIDEEPRFRERGLDSLTEYVVLVKRIG